MAPTWEIDFTLTSWEKQQVEEAQHVLLLTSSQRTL